MTEATSPEAAGRAVAVAGDVGENARVSQLLARYERAVRRKQLWQGTWQEIYDYMMPSREGFYEFAEGQKRTELIFDETAVVGLPEFAANISAGLTPAFAEIFRLVPGKELARRNRSPRLQADLDEVTDFLHECFRNSNFQQEAGEFYLDLAIGTGNLRIDSGDFAGSLSFAAEPLTRVTVDAGPLDDVDGRFLCRQVPLAKILTVWPLGTISPRMEQDLKADRDGTKETKIVEMVYRDWSAKDAETWTYCVIAEEYKHEIWKRTMKGEGSNPWITARWNKAAGDLYGRGPALNILPAVKTLNFVIELTLENAQMAIGGVWTYDDDGVINPDTIILEPATFIPKARGSEIAPLQSASQFDVGNLILDEMRRNVRKGLFLDDVGDQMGKTPPSASQVVEERIKQNRRMGGVFGRLQHEFLFPLVKRGVWILKEQGIIGELPKLDGRQLGIQIVSPMARSQNEQHIQDYLRFASTLQAVYGPQAATVFLKMEEGVTYIREKYGIPQKLINGPAEAKKLLEGAMAAMTQAQAQFAQAEQGAPPPPA